MAHPLPMSNIPNYTGSMDRVSSIFFAVQKIVHGPLRRSLRRNVMSEIEVSAQPVDATQALNLSAGVSNVKVLYHFYIRVS